MIDDYSNWPLPAKKKVHYSWPTTHLELDKPNTLVGSTRVWLWTQCDVMECHSQYFYLKSCHIYIILFLIRWESLGSFIHFYFSSSFFINWYWKISSETNNTGVRLRVVKCELVNYLPSQHSLDSNFSLFFHFFPTRLNSLSFAQHDCYVDFCLLAEELSKGSWIILKLLNNCSAFWR